MSMTADTSGRKRSTLADIRTAQLRAMEQGNRPLVATLELIAIHRKLEEQGYFKDDGTQDPSSPNQP
jgi:hypothetical protein